ncbi:hypothetical protein [Flavobacterium sp. JP2137]|uniref:hypothetical protein n=1 Tax=Flavobacterium sp. JP2137 TaxID=3414510 RepID=UPI003D2FAAF0
MSVDPLAEKYPGIGGYVYVANNPVNAIDPDGRDIVYLNKVGSIIKVVNDGKSQIVIIDGGKTRLLSDYSIGRSWFGLNNRNRQVVANIGGYYGRKMEINGVGASYVSSGIAHFDPKDNGIWIAPGVDGKVSSSLNDKNNLMNVLFHEGKHREDDLNGVNSTYESHASVYISQMGNSSFSKATEDFQDGMVGNMLNYIIGVENIKVRGELIDNFNDTNVGGYKLDKSYRSGYGWGVSKNGGTKEYLNPVKPKSPN